MSLQEIERLDAIIEQHPDDADALYRRGTLHWQMGLRAQAITDLNKAAKLNPTGPAPAAVAFITGIMDFFSPQNP